MRFVIIFYFKFGFASVNISFCKSIHAKVSVHVFILSLYMKSKIKRVALHACQHVCVRDCVFPCSLIAAADMASCLGEADNSPKCCPWFRVLMNSTAEKLLTGGPCIASDWLLMQLAFGSVKMKGKEKTQTDCVSVLAWSKTAEKNLTLMLYRPREQSLALIEAPMNRPDFRRPSGCFFMLMQ